MDKSKKNLLEEIQNSIDDFFDYHSVKYGFELNGKLNISLEEEKEDISYYLVSSSITMEVECWYGDDYSTIQQHDKISVHMQFSKNTPLILNYDALLVSNGVDLFEQDSDFLKDHKDKYIKKKIKEEKDIITSSINIEKSDNYNTKSKHRI